MFNASHFIHYTSEDFAANESFQAYVFRTRPEDIRFWETFIKQHPEKQPQIEEAVELLSLLAPNKASASNEQKEADMQCLLAALGEAATVPVVPLSAEKPTRRTIGKREFDGYRQWRNMAAALIGILLVAGTGYFVADWFAGQTIRYQTAYGESATFVLPDSSVVILNGNTRLSHAAGWDGQSTREVWLEGEAFFDVKHKNNSANARFVVHTPGLDVEVVGTRFNVFNRDDKTNVVLNSGKVKVHVTSENDTSSVMMQPGEAVEYIRKKETIVKKQVNAEALTSWRNKVLVFEDMPLYKIGEIIEYTYGVEVVFADSVQANQKLAGTIPSDNLDVLLTVLAKSSNLNIQRVNNQIIIENR